jgi:hypothetical protein
MKKVFEEFQFYIFQNFYKYDFKEDPQYLNYISRYPTVSPRAEFHESKAQSHTVANARFLSLDQSIVSVGGSDAALMLWDVVDE